MEFTITIPDEILPDMQAALQERYGAGADAAQLFREWVRPIYVAYMKRQAQATAIQAEVDARLAVEAALAVEVAARKQAEKDAEEAALLAVEAIV